MAARRMYLDLLKRILINTIYCDPHTASWGDPLYIREQRLEGRDCPKDAHSMVGMKRLDNLQFCVEQVIHDRVSGDLMETGVWRGGSCILMKAILVASGDTERKVWLADSFEGLPPPDLARYPLDTGLDLSSFKELAVPVEIVKNNFSKYGLLDDQVLFLEGWFRDTLPSCPVEKLAVLRLDGDLYESTMIALECLYHKVSPAGFVIVDDFGAFAECQAAVVDFRKRMKITEPIIEIDWTGIYWRKESRQ